MKNTWMMLLTLALGGLLLAPAAVADVLIIDEVRQVEKMDLPENGQSKADVESRFGAPRQKQGPVGDPPISRWDYDGYSVYFEYELVLFSVLHPGEVIEPNA
ncbi:MAG: hypothetical protein P8008_06760 [Gammaproteobacteria bacterium]